MWMGRISLSVGIASPIEIIIRGLLHFEGGPGLSALFHLWVYVVPFLGGLAIAWRKPPVRGVLLLVTVFGWFVFELTVGLLLRLESLPFLFTVTVCVAFPMLFLQLVTGAKFLLQSTSAPRGR